jgi:peptidase M48-like protein
MILLSSEEEDEIASQLAGPGWFKFVGEILAREGSLKIIPSNDWRYGWVRDTLRKLETSISVLASEPELSPKGGSDYRPQPPPAQYPLRPRPRASEYLHHYCSKLCRNPATPKLPNPTTPGPPYSLIVVDKPELSNAFSYGFGPDGGSGIVVYSGFLDDIFAKMPPQYETSHPSQKQTFLSKFFGGIFSNSPSPPPHPIPTEEQTAELAILLAHEMAHLILCHHLESLSSVTVIVPGTLSIAADVIRVLIFPFTMLFGPFVNDAVAQLGKVGSLELAKISEHCTSTKQEIEADVVSARQVLLSLSRNEIHHAQIY